MTDDFHKQTTLPDLHAGQSRFPLPSKIGPYKIESQLNKGGMSLLYLGVHPDTAEPIVIKILLPKYLKNKEIVTRFLKEAQIIEMTDHPNIVKLYGQGRWEKGLYIAMEFIQGISLRQFIQKKSLSSKRALEIILQVAYALSHLHAHGVIHRDLKPENILITESGEIKVIDFGIAQLHGEEERITQKKRMMGTPIYMSPEQKEHPSQVCCASDIYSLGIIAYELVLGRLSHGVIHLALLPRALRLILEKALRPDPKQRYQDIIDFIKDISHYIATLADESQEEEISEEVLQLIQETQSILAPKKSPSWPQLEIGIALNEAGQLYLDFFQLPGNQYCIIVADPIQSGIGPLVHIAILRGMVRMAIHEGPEKLLASLNQILHTDPMQQHFSFSLLLLNPEKNRLTFTSCQGSHLWHLAQGEPIRALSTPNAALGAEPNSRLLDISDNWNAGDLLILHSPGALWTDEYKLLAPQPQAERIMQTTPGQKAVLTLQRIF